MRPSQWIATGLFLLIYGWIAVLVARKRRALARSPQPAPSSGVAHQAGGDMEGRMNALFVALVIASGLAGYLTLVSVGDWRAQMLPVARVTLHTGEPLWACIAIFAGLAGGMLAIGPVAILLWDESARGYADDMAIRYHTDYFRLCARLGMGLGAGVLAFALIGLNGYVQLRDDAVAIHPYFALAERVHAFSGIRRIEASNAFRAPRGNIVHRRTWTVRFKDHDTWTSDQSPFGYEGALEDFVLQLSARSGIPITEVRGP